MRAHVHGKTSRPNLRFVTTCKGTGIAKTTLPPGATRAGGSRWGPRRRVWDKRAGGRGPGGPPTLPFQTLRKVLLLQRKGTQQAPLSGGQRPSAWGAGAGASGQVCVRLPLGPTAPASHGPTSRLRLGQTALEGTPFLPRPQPRVGSPYFGGALGLRAALMGPAPPTHPASQVPLGLGERPTLPVGAAGPARPSRGPVLPPTW